MPQPPRCGIDFGTSNTTMAIHGANGPELLGLENGATTIPTAIFFPENKNHPVLFGRAAMKAYLDGHEGRLMRSLKRVLGTSLMQQGTMVRGSRWQFAHIVGQFLAHIKHYAENTVQSELTSVTLGRPVHFQDNDPAADARAESELRDIAAQVGFTDIRFQFEPIAAALSHERKIFGEQLALVVDIGGGTSDFSVIRLSRNFRPERDRSRDILGNYGVRVGGNDCDKAINLEMAMPLLGMNSIYGDKNLEMPHLIYHELSEWSKINWCYTPQNINMVLQLEREAHEPIKLQRLHDVLEHQSAHHVLNVSEETKITLTEKENTVADFGFVENGLTAEMSQQKMDALLRQTLDSVRAMMLESVTRAGVKAEDIAVVVLTGGTTGLPLFRDWLKQYFPAAEVMEDNRLGSVGLGLVL